MNFRMNGEPVLSKIPASTWVLRTASCMVGIESGWGGAKKFGPASASHPQITQADGRWRSGRVAHSTICEEAASWWKREKGGRVSMKRWGLYLCSTKTREVLGNPSRTPKRFPKTSRVLVEHGYNVHVFTHIAIKLCSMIGNISSRNNLSQDTLFMLGKMGKSGSNWPTLRSANYQARMCTNMGSNT